MRAGYVSATTVRLVAWLTVAAGCRGGARYDPAHDLGPLFQDVQLSGIFADSKTFVDARPLLGPPSTL